MNESMMGGIVPIWIIGAPLLFAVIELMRTPKPSTTHRRPDSVTPNPSVIPPRTPSAAF